MMSHGSNAMLLKAGRHEPAAMAGAPWWRRGNTPLALVAGAFTAGQLLLGNPDMGLGWDESVYVSQVSDQAPAAFFSAPRARGVPLLVAPVALWSSSTGLLRLFLAVLSGLALFLALRAWRGLFPTRVLAAGGALFATLWVVLYYGPQAMPNLWVALGGLFTVGCYLRARAARRPDRGAWWGVAAGAAFMALMRPTDAVYVALPLLAAALAGRHWRLGLVTTAGLAAGAVPWVVEAYTSYGGLRERLDQASRVQGGLGWNFAVDDQMRSLGGRTLCRPCTVPMPDPVLMVWWFLLPLLALLGLAVAVRAGRTARTLLPLACATTAAVPCLFLIGYAAPRFLTPAYALVALPVADGLLHLVRTRAGRWRPLATGVLAVAVAGHLAVQYAVLHGMVDRTTAHHGSWARNVETMRSRGVRPPCLLLGHEAIPVAYYAGCASGAIRGNNANITRAEILSTARREPVAVLSVPGGTPPAYARDWELHHLDGVDVRIAPAPREGGTP